MVHTFAQLYSQLRGLTRKQRTLLVGIDGCGGSGKTTFARSLQRTGADVTIVHMDDFYLSSDKRRLQSSGGVNLHGESFDWQRLQREVLVPLARDERGKYQRYDWPSDSLAEWIGVEVGGMVLIEGVSSTRGELRDFYDFRVFVDCPRHLRIARGVQRDGEAARARWEKDWCPKEDRYIEIHAPQRYAHLVIDGADRAGVDNEREFVAPCAG